MVKYILKRLMWAVITIWATITITFIIMHSIPGDPFAKEGTMPPAVYENLKQYYDLDSTKLEQYVQYLQSLVMFDFGPSLKSKTLTVNDYIEKGFPVSLHLGAQSMLIAVFFGLILGVIAALYRTRWPDHVAMVIAVFGISVPSFILATLLINFLAVELKIFPVATWQSWKHTVLPSIALAMLPLAHIARLMRASMIEVLNQEYILTAKAKGLRKSTVIIKHAIRNAILPVVTIAGTLTVNLVTGSFIVESIFGIPGMGEMFVTSILNRDYPVILGATVFYSSILVIVLLIIDIAYTFIDPRIKVAVGRGQ
ncbi:MAG: ABC transporter permease [Bacillus sp. (in: firmicutes)]